jgi:hypothetical protein
MSDVQTILAAWIGDNAVIQARHANAGLDTAVSFGPCMDLAPTAPAAQRHGRLDVGPETVVAFGPSLEIPVNPR